MYLLVGYVYYVRTIYAFPVCYEDKWYVHNPKLTTVIAYVSVVQLWVVFVRTIILHI